MTTQRDGSTCDRCGKRTSLDNAFPHCRECHDDVCPDCCIVYDPDPPGYAKCKQCAAERHPRRDAMDDDAAWEMYQSDVDDGRICPHCRGRERITRAAAFGIPLFVCGACRCEWFGLWEIRKETINTN